MNSFWQLFGANAATEQIRSADNVSSLLNENIIGDLSATTTTWPSRDNYDWLDALSTQTETNGVANWFSPYGLLNYVSGGAGDDAQIATDLFQLYTDPDSMSYLRLISTYVKIIAFFMPAAGIVQQTYFAIAMAKITFKAATMYYGGHGTTEIAIALIPDITNAALFVRTISARLIHALPKSKYYARLLRYDL